MEIIIIMKRMIMKKMTPGMNDIYGKIIRRIAIIDINDNDNDINIYDINTIMILLITTAT